MQTDLDKVDSSCVDGMMKWMIHVAAAVPVLVAGSCLYLLV
eukprot:COSAG04_NODE_474_length_13783_cov_18.185691_2_plen_41_part_00